MRGLGAHIALYPNPSGHFLDEVSCGSYLRLLAFRNLEPGTRERRHHLCVGHVMPFHGRPYPSRRYSGGNCHATEAKCIKYRAYYPPGGEPHCVNPPPVGDSRPI